MKLQDDQLTRVFDYLDGKMTNDELSRFENEVSQNEMLRKLIDELRTADSFARRHVADQPTRSLTQKVMSNLQTISASRSSLSVKNGLFLLAGICAVIAIAAILLSTGLFDTAVTTVDPNNIDLIRKYTSKPLPSIGVDIKLLVNIVVFLNLIIGLIVLDRSVLKPLFQRRMQAAR